uniref:ornithine carbamoyltransferase n=1 Tax=Chromera velia CCMP2878 TaxID=1169474 RepID=A0A0G4F667_9ALVE|eukprot:Cvel_15340.t1-p1 / transcript=Cvel_15340.t1 / gene=Cvel_15340 / organism=Chromera_velia_CCMP2878 / gene_product=Ornithine carbamoyltransferase, putative / transcript_product=Ornithine carbamoyltransferase, putative / location=Cvel_scaffold1129:1122-3064(+) / protein_length=386 / sequence_SO=supercontig / SO=protein_coding / is_pseudo=false
MSVTGTLSRTNSASVLPARSPVPGTTRPPTPLKELRCAPSLEELKTKPVRVGLKDRSCLTLLDYTREEISFLLELAEALKFRRKVRRSDQIENPLLRSKNVALIFEKDSTRTRCAFEVACYDEGAKVTNLNSASSHIGKKESVEDTGKTLGRMFDGLQYRGKMQETVQTLAKVAGVPVFNGLTDWYHPTQALADLLTIREMSRQPFEKTRVCFVGDVRNNVSFSLAAACAKLGLKFVGVGPLEYQFTADQMATLRAVCAKSKGGSVSQTSDLEGVRGATVVYTDVWVSMGDETETEERIKALLPYKVDRSLMDMTGNDRCLFMHCLPSFHDLNTATALSVFDSTGLRELEVSDEVFRSPQSVVFDQAENRLHTIKALMVASLSDEF